MIKKAMTFRRLITLSIGVLVFLSSPVLAAMVNFDYPNMLAAYIKFSGDFRYDDYRDGLIQVFHPPWWMQYQHDEFALKGREDTTVAEVKNMVAKLDDNIQIKLGTSAPFSDYDFKQNGFEFHPIEPGTYFSVSPPCCSTLPKMEVEIVNPDFINLLPMAKDDAQRFLEARHNNRNVNVVLTVHLLSVADDPQTSAATFQGKVTGISVYDPVSRNKLLFSQ